MAITGTIRGTSREKASVSQIMHLLQDIEEINLRVISATYYLLEPARASQDHLTIYPVFTLNITFSKILFFPSAIIEWNNLDISIHNSKSKHFQKKYSAI